MTLIRGKMRRPSGDCAIPRWTRRSVGRDSIRWPSKLTVPRSGRTEPMIVLSVVVLPAPFDPISVTISPRPTASDTPLSARMFP